jgi:tetratricopeptide (TPR) repeat protein
MKYDLKILSKLLSNNSLNQFYYLVEDLLDDKSIQDSALFNLIGIYFQKKNKARKALNYFNKSLVLKPDTFQVLNNRGVIYFLLEEIDLAINDFNQSLLINSKIHDTYLSLAKCYLHKDNVQKAIEILEECKNKLD